MTGRQLLAYMQAEMKTVGMLDKPVMFAADFIDAGRVPVSFYVDDDGKGWIDLTEPNFEHAHAAEKVRV